MMKNRKEIYRQRRNKNIERENNKETRKVMKKENV